jgi:hypothetical protein
MRKKPSLKSLTQWTLFVGAVFRALASFIDLLSKVVNYARPAPKLRIQIQ